MAGQLGFRIPDSACRRTIYTAFGCPTGAAGVI
jgi:hypothetical protein